MYSQIEEEYISVSGDFKESSESIIVDSMQENLSLNSNMRIFTQGKCFVAEDSESLDLET